jgi:hypothetical protein
MAESRKRQNKMWCRSWQSRGKLLLRAITGEQTSGTTWLEVRAQVLRHMGRTRKASRGADWKRYRHQTSRVRRCAAVWTVWLTRSCRERLIRCTCWAIVSTGGNVSSKKKKVENERRLTIYRVVLSPIMTERHAMIAKMKDRS